MEPRGAPCTRARAVEYRTGGIQLSDTDDEFGELQDAEHIQKSVEDFERKKSYH